MTWMCPNCRESVDRSFDICWNCGSRNDGATDPNFQHADQYQPTPRLEKKQISVWRLMQLVTGLAFLIAMMVGSTRNGVANRLVFAIGLIASGALFLNGFRSFLVWFTDRLNDGEHDQDARPTGRQDDGLRDQQRRDL